MNDKIKITKEIVDFWYTIEFLTQENFPKQDAYSKKVTNRIRKYSQDMQNKKPKSFLSKKFTIYSKLANHFEIDNIIEKGNEHYRFHQEISSIGHVCYGKVKREAVIKKLYKVLEVKDKRQERDWGQICLFAFKRNVDGVYEEKSLQLSPLIWGLYQCDNNSKSKNKGISHIEYKETIEKLEKSLPSDKRVNNKFIDFIYSMIYKKYISPLGLQNHTTKEGIFVYSRFSNKRIKEEKEDKVRDLSELARSYYSDDLSMIREQLNERISSKEMRNDVINYITNKYLNQNKNLEQNRIDIRVNKKELQSILSVNNISLGKWPSKYSPALMQQVAINYLSKEEEYRNIFSVNGPPGTGKTTLLKEVIAHNIVERAVKISKYLKADDAFNSSYFYDKNGQRKYYDKYITKYYSLKDSSINHHSMLVTSNNNAAVENITVDLPNAEDLIDSLEPTNAENDVEAQALNEIKNLFTISKCNIKESYWEFRKNPDADNDPKEPKKKKVEEKKEDIYFSWLAHKRETNDNETHSHRINTWGLISAPLGKKSNIAKYYYNVLSHFIENALKFPNDCKSFETKYSNARNQFNKQLERVKSLKSKLVDDMKVESVFNNKKNKKDRIISELNDENKKYEMQINQINDEINKLTVHKIPFLEKNINENNLMMKKIQDDIELLNFKANNFDKEFFLIHNKIIDLKKEISLVEKILYSFFGRLPKNHSMIKLQEKEKATIRSKVVDINDRIFMLREKLKEKKQRDNTFKFELAKSKEEIKEYSASIDEHKKMIRANKSYKEKIKRDLERELNQFNQKIAELKETRQLLDDKFWEKLKSSDEELSTEAQLTNPWVTSEFNREREKLFYYALQLHKYFILSSNACRCNFNHLGMMWGYKKNKNGKVPNYSVNHKEEAFPHVLSTLFLLTPVISTTFASVGSFLKDLKEKNSIGLLIVDEAGQATPQIAIGSLWRARRSIIVGDPKQVEPVVTSDSEIIMKAFSNEVVKLYQSKTLSVQGFSDAINPIGSIIIDENDAVNHGEWVGCPLVVHRRCINPMFGVSNELSYGNTMKYKTQSTKASIKKKFVMKESCWLNVGGSEVGQKNHYVKEQGKVVLDIVKKSFEIYKATGNKKSERKPSLYIISPFTTVVHGVRTILKSDKELRNYSMFDEWLSESIGTVHKFQGKEANEVIFVLGCDKKATGAVHWVNNNILNVAVTRAKYRFYLIGEHSVWSQSKIFALASNYLVQKNNIEEEINSKGYRTEFVEELTSI